MIDRRAAAFFGVVQGEWSDQVFSFGANSYS
jgi:hypothetical protein